MQSKISLKHSLSIAGIAFFLVVVFCLIENQFPRGYYVKTMLPDSEIVLKYTIRLKIPEINVDIVVEQLGLTIDGFMDASKDPASAAWFALGPRPGEKGSAVISGHYGWKNGMPAIFDNLHKLVKGDRLYVEDEKGAITTFVVQEIRTYGQNDDVSAVFTSSDGKAHLNLITCEAVWDKVSKSYSNRLVVFSDKEAK
jgi:LPXTG-site transpeptidase (sortase) family protein